MRRSLGHLLNREQSRGFCAWVLMVGERAAALDAMRRGLLFMLKRTLALGFASWSGRSGVVGAEPMSKPWGAFVHREMSRGFGWHSHWEARRARLASMRRSLGHLLNREQSRGFCAWVLIAAALDAMRRGLLFMLKRTLALGFASWSGRSGVVGVEPMSKALRYFVHREMSRGWVGWHSHWEARRARLASMRRSLGHLLNREQSRGFCAWS